MKLPTVARKHPLAEFPGKRRCLVHTERGLSGEPEGLSHEKHELAEAFRSNPDEHVGLRHQLQLHQSLFQRDFSLLLAGVVGGGQRGRANGKVGNRHPLGLAGKGGNVGRWGAALRCTGKSLKP